MNEIKFELADGKTVFMDITREEELQATADSIDRFFESLAETKWYEWIKRIELKAIILNRASHMAQTVRKTNFKRTP